MLQEFHDTPSGGHAGIKRTLVRLAANFFWPGMRQSVINYIAQCTICQQIKSATTVPAGLLQPLPIPEAVWDDITMDFITALPVSRGMTTILVVVDHLSKYIHLGALPANFTAAKVAELFVEIVVKHHGFPKSIVSDRDPVFVSTFWRRLFELSGTKLSMSSSYHPQTDGQTEVVNRGLEQYLRAFVQDNPKTWLFFLCWAEFITIAVSIAVCKCPLFRHCMGAHLLPFLTILEPLRLFKLLMTFLHNATNCSEP